MAEQTIYTERITPNLGLFLPEPEHQSWEDHYINDRLLQDWIIGAQQGANLLLAGEFSGGSLKNIVIQFTNQDGSITSKVFPDTVVTITDKRQIWCAEKTSGVMGAIDLPGAKDVFITPRDYSYTSDPDLYPLLHTGYYQKTVTVRESFARWLGGDTRRPIVTLVKESNLYDYRIGSAAALALNQVNATFTGVRFENRNGQEIVFADGSRIHFQEPTVPATANITISGNRLRITCEPDAWLDLGENAANGNLCYDLILKGDEVTFDLLTRRDTWKGDYGWAIRSKQRFLKCEGARINGKLNHRIIYGHGFCGKPYLSFETIADPYQLMFGNSVYYPKKYFRDLYKIVGVMSLIPTAVMRNQLFGEPIATALNGENFALGHPENGFLRAFYYDPKFFGRPAKGNSAVTITGTPVSGTHQITNLPEGDMIKCFKGQRIRGIGLQDHTTSPQGCVLIRHVDPISRSLWVENALTPEADLALPGGGATTYTLDNGGAAVQSVQPSVVGKHNHSLALLEKPFIFFGNQTTTTTGDPLSESVSVVAQVQSGVQWTWAAPNVAKLTVSDHSGVENVPSNVLVYYYTGV